MIIEFLYIFILFSTSIYVELLFGSFGVTLPLLAVLVFYFTITYDWRTALFLLIISGMIVDNLYARPFPITPFSLCLVFITALFWLHRGESKSLLLHTIPGVLIAFLYMLPLFIAELLSSGSNWGIISRTFPNLLLGLLFTAFLLPASIIILDYCSEVMGFELYSNAKDKLVERKE